MGTKGCALDFLVARPGRWPRSGARCSRHLVEHGATGHTGVMPFTIRTAALADMEDLQGVFQRASLSNEDDRDRLLEHPEWLSSRTSLSTLDGGGVGLQRHWCWTFRRT